VYLEVVSVQSKARDTITDPGERERNRDESCVCCLGRIRRAFSIFSTFGKDETSTEREMTLGSKLALSKLIVSYNDQLHHQPHHTPQWTNSACIRRGQNEAKDWMDGCSVVRQILLIFTDFTSWRWEGDQMLVGAYAGTSMGPLCSRATSSLGSH